MKTIALLALCVAGCLWVIGDIDWVESVLRFHFPFSEVHNRMKFFLLLGLVLGRIIWKRDIPTKMDSWWPVIAWASFLLFLVIAQMVCGLYQDSEGPTDYFKVRDDEVGHRIGGRR